MPGPEDDLALLTDAARAAGIIALRHFAGDRASWEKEGGQGPLTKADLEVDEMLRTELLRARPDYGWLSEETPDSPDRLARQSVFIVDPIDGTRAFVEGERNWAHSLSVVRDGVVTAGVVYLPARDRLYGAALGSGARLNGDPIHVTATPTEADATILTSRVNLKSEHWPGGVPPMALRFRSSFANRLALVAHGQYDAMVSFRPAWEWDIAAGTLILSEAGGQVSDAGGGGFAFNSAYAQQAGVLGANAALHRQLMARIAA